MGKKTKESRDKQGLTGDKQEYTQSKEEYTEAKQEYTGDKSTERKMAVRSVIKKQTEQYSDIDSDDYLELIRYVMGKTKPGLLQGWDSYVAAQEETDFDQMAWDDPRLLLPPDPNTCRNQKQRIKAKKEELVIVKKEQCK